MKAQSELLKEYNDMFPNQIKIAGEIGIHPVNLSKFKNNRHVGELTLRKIVDFMESRKGLFIA